MNKEEEDEKITWSCWLRTLFACSGAMLCFIFSGVTEAQSSTLLPQLKAKDSIIHVTPEEETWIASLGILMAPIASVVVGPTIDLIGRKKGLLFFYLDMGVGFTIIACATEVWHIYVGRCVCSFAIGMEVAAVVYFAETCTKKQRSVLLSIISASFTFGVSLTYFVGGYLPWNVASGVFALGCFLYFLIQLLAPESPAWLYKKGDIDASKRSLQRLGRSPSGILRELEMLRLSSKEQSEKFQFKVFLEPTVWKPFLIMCIFHILLNLSGVFHIMYYTLDFIERLGTSYDPLTVSIIISVTRVISCSTVGIYSTAYVGRKPATIVSSILMTLSFLSAGIYEYVFRDTPVGQKPYEWVPIVLLISNLVSGILAVAILPWLISGELFPLQNRQHLAILEAARENIRKVKEPCSCRFRSLFSFNSRQRNQQSTPSADINKACRDAFALLKPWTEHQIGECALAKNPRCMWDGCGRKCYADFELTHTGRGRQILVEFAECASRAIHGWAGATFPRDRPPLNMDDVGH